MYICFGLEHVVDLLQEAVTANIQDNVEQELEKSLHLQELHDTQMQVGISCLKRKPLSTILGNNQDGLCCFAWALRQLHVPHGPCASL